MDHRRRALSTAPLTATGTPYRIGRDRVTQVALGIGRPNREPGVARWSLLAESKVLARLVYSVAQLGGLEDVERRAEFDQVAE